MGVRADSIIIALVFSMVPPLPANIPFPSSRSAFASASALGRISFQPNVECHIITPGIAAVVTVAAGPYGGVPIGGAGGSFFHPANSSAKLISLHKSQASSEPAATRPENSWPENGFIFSMMRSLNSWEIERGASRVSNAMILDCCALLIPSSKINNQTVQAASIATPPITSHLATRWVESGYSLASRIIPAATANEANMLTDKSQKWGQNGHDVSGNNVLRYVSIPAILSWCFVSLLAIIQLIRSLFAHAMIIPPPSEGVKYNSQKICLANRRRRRKQGRFFRN
jgi:hypothetical protein